MNAREHNARHLALRDGKDWHQLDDPNKNVYLRKAQETEEVLIVELDEKKDADEKPQELKPSEYLCSKCNSPHRKTSRIGKKHLQYDGNEV